MRKYRYILVFLLLTFSRTFAGVNFEGIDIVNLNRNSGLASNEVTSILQDNQGFVWFGTNNGLCRYDGYQFDVYRSDYLYPNLLSSNHILLMAKDKSNCLWLVTTKGVDKFDASTGKAKHIESRNIIQKTIKKIFITRKGKVLLGTTKGVYVFDKKNSDFKLLFKDAYVRSLYEDIRGILWVGTWGGGFFTLDIDKKTKTEYDIICKGKSLAVTDFVEDKWGNIWISTWGRDGLYCLKDPFNSLSSDFKVYPASNQKGSLPDNVIYSLAYDKKSDNVWVATAKGLAVLTDKNNSNSFRIYDTKELGGDEIWTVYKDNNDIIWVSVLGAGVSKLVKRAIPFNHHSFSLTDKNTIVTALYEDQNSLLWIGARADVLLFYNQKTDKLYSYKDIPALKSINKSSNAIIAFLENRNDGKLWMATRYNGIFIVEKKGSKIIGLRNLGPAVHPALNSVKSMVQDKNGKIWIGTADGLFITSYNQKNRLTISHVKDLDKLINNDGIQTLYCDSENKIWAGTQNNGAVCLSEAKNGKFTIDKYCVANGNLNYDNVTCFFVDSKHSLWIGTQGGGISKFLRNENRFAMLKNMHMIPDNAVYSILEDDNNNLWLSTGNGLICIDSKKQDRVSFYTPKEGIHNTLFMKGASLKLRSSKLLFGGYNGVDCFNKKISYSDSSTFQTAIIGISVMNVPLDKLVKENKIKNVLLPPFTKELELSYNENNVMFNFCSTSYTNPQANRYAYKLEGIDRDWTYVDANKRYISYNNLPKGTYKFKVKSCNENSIWTSPVELELTILPAFWETWWAFIIYILLIVSSVIVSYKRIKKRIELQNELKIEKIEHKKSEEVNQTKLSFFTNISHELFTPLSVLLCAIESLKQSKKSDTETLNIMKLNLNRLQRLLQQIMEFRKAESGNLKLKVSNSDIVVFVKNLCEENFYPLLESKQIMLNFQSEDDVIMAYFDVDKMDKIIYNLLSNALKYNYIDGVVLVALSTKYCDGVRNIVLKVENTGDGIPEERIPNLFKRFYDGDYRKFKTKGTGIGLSLTKDLVTLHNGTISVYSNPVETTVFSVIFPADKESYLEEQIDSESELLRNIPSELGADDSIEVNTTEKSTILLVEDDADLLTIMKKTVGRYFNLVTAINGKEAIDILKDDEKIEIVVTDYLMPVMSGVELSKAIRNDISLCHLPIILLTAMTQVEDKLLGFDAGADAYIPKPFELHVLIAQIKSLIANRRLLAKKYKEQDDIKINELSLTPLDQSFMDKAIIIIEESLTNGDITNEQFYHAMSMTQSTLYRKLKSLTGLSPNEFIRNIKIKKACHMLTDNSVRIADVAYAVGFNDPKYFSIIFKKEKGMSPTEYIEQLKSKKK